METIDDHAVRFSHHPLADRLSQVGLTPAGYKRLTESLEAHRVRESSISMEEVAGAVQFFVDHPNIGAAKARLSLIDKETAALSTVTVNQVKQELTRIVGQRYQLRKEEEKQLEAELRAHLLACRQEGSYEHFRAEYPDHVWSMDFSRIMVLGMPVALCEVYDEYSQNYLALEAGCFADHELAVSSFQKALEHALAPPKWLRRDNGKPFLTEAFQQALEGGGPQDCPIPPGSPWFNGSLESSHTSLKNTIKTTVMQDMAHNPALFRECRQDPSAIVDLLQGIIDRVRVLVNEDISRLKQGMPPAKVYNGEEAATRRRHQVFIARKHRERRHRMATLRALPDDQRPYKTMLEKIEVIARKIIDSMETSALYTLNEVLHHRYHLCET